MFHEYIPPIANENDIGIVKVDGETIDINENGLLCIPGPPSLALQTTGSDSEIQAMLKAYYAGRLTLADIQSVQSVGDARQANSTDKALMKIAAHNNFEYDVHETVVEQTTPIQVILDFDHDTLTNAVGSITKALVTIQMKGMLGDAASSSTYAMGQMNVETTNVNGQGGCARRTQCNGNFYNALGFKDWIKQVSKPYCALCTSSAISYSDDYVFLLSEAEVFASYSQGPGQDGSQYSYYETVSNRVKKQGQNASGENFDQFLRSPLANDPSYWLDIYNDGSIYFASGAVGISPACCL